MKDEIIRELSQRLKSGRYLEGKTFLRRDEHYDPLGVLCCIYGEQYNIPWSIDARGNFNFMGNYRVLPRKVAAEFDTSEDGYFYSEKDNRSYVLSVLADEGHSFQEIAKLLDHATLKRETVWR